MNGKVVGIFTTAQAGAPLHAVSQAMLEAGRGLVGDRYYEKDGTFSEKLKDSCDWELTLIESEEIERFNSGRGTDLGPGQFRRNIITSGIGLNELVGRRFNVGEAVLEGLILCEPCAYLAKLLGPDVVKSMAHRAGLRARIVTGSIVRPGDSIVAAVQNA